MNLWFWHLRDSAIIMVDLAIELLNEQNSQSGNRRPQGEAAALRDAIAKVGIGCRFPGADGVSTLWRMLDAGGSGVIEGLPGFGMGRIGKPYLEKPGKALAYGFGAYPDDINRFGTAFFHILPAELQILDPRQKMKRDTRWSSLEDAGVEPDRLKGSRTSACAGYNYKKCHGLFLGNTRPDER